MNKKKTLFTVFIVLNLLFSAFAFGFVFKIYGVSFATLSKVNEVNSSTLNKIISELVNQSLPEPSLMYGFSGTPTTQAGIDDIISNMTLYGMNTYRISFTPDWAAGTRPYNLTQMTYFLNNTPASWNLIVDRNHQLDSPSMNWANWQQANQSIYDDILLIPQLANNSRVIIEIINEYVFNGSANVWAGTEWIVDGIQADGYTNPLLINKHSISDDWAQGAAIPYDFYGHHMYMSNLNETDTQQTYWQGQNVTKAAENAGAVPGVNTEVGAHHLEFANFNQTNVDLLKDYILWSRNRPVPFGNMIWMNKDLRNLATYLTFDLFEGL